MTQHPGLPRAEHPARNRRRGGPKARLAAATAAVAAVAALLSGCGIRDTALPVDAGQGASRTACPPAPGVSLSQLDRDAYETPAADWAAPSATSTPAAAATAAVAAAPTPSGTLSCLQPGADPSAGSSSGPAAVTRTGAPSSAPSP